VVVAAAVTAVAAADVNVVAAATAAAIAVAVTNRKFNQGRRSSGRRLSCCLEF
jgi:hypothetical protein